MLEDGSYEIMLGEDVSSIIASSQIEVRGQQIMRNNNPLLEDYFDYTKIKDISIESFEALLGRKVPVYKAPKKPYTMETSFGEMNSFTANILKKNMEKVGKDALKEAYSIDDDLKRQRMIITAKMMYRSINANCIRSLYFASAGKVTKEMAEGMLDIANGHIIRGYKKVKGKM